MLALRQQLVERAQKLGFDRVGVIEANPGQRLTAYLQWISAGMQGEMGYLAREDRLLRRRDLNVILPGIQSIICVGLNYATYNLPDEIAQDPSRGRISNYAWGADYHDVMIPRLQELADWVTSVSGSAVQSRVYVDTGPLLERDHAETADLGFTGKNTMLIHPRRGTYFFLGELLTTLQFTSRQPPATSYQRPSCGTCRRCLDACPTAAFPTPYVLDARRCISYLTIELKGWIPRVLRPLIGNWVYGCDICQEVCPFNRFAKPTNEAAFYPGGKVHHKPNTKHLLSLDSIAPPLLDLLVLDEVAFNKRFANSPIKRITRTRLVRNACVAAGNWGDETAVFPLIHLLHDPEPLIRGHAAWALRQIGIREAETAVARALQKESDEIVRQEMSD